MCRDWLVRFILMPGYFDEGPFPMFNEGYDGGDDWEWRSTGQDSDYQREEEEDY